MKPKTRINTFTGKHKDAGTQDHNLGESAVGTRLMGKKNCINFTWILRQTLKSCISRDLSRDGNMKWCKPGPNGGFFFHLSCNTLAIFEKNNNS